MDEPPVMATWPQLAAPLAEVGEVDRRPSTPPPGEPLGIGVMLLFAGAGAAAVVWAGAQLAGRLGRGAWLDARLPEAVHALLRLPDNAGDPRMAWAPELRAALPGPALYWACTLAVLMAAVGAVVLAWRAWPDSGVGEERRHRLGVDTASRLATPRDIAPLVVRGPVEGRFILGRVAGRLVATENRQWAQRRRRGPRHGDRSAVCVIGPTRCGKTANTISGILEWEGPAILSSVKTDLLQATLSQRQALGNVKIFDPTGITGRKAGKWSPLWNAKTLVGAQKAAAALRAASPRPSERTATHELFSGLAEQLLWPLFYTAAVSKLTMGHVVRWLLTCEHPVPGKPGEVGELLEVQKTEHGENARTAAEAAEMTLQSIWRQDERMRSDIYVTAQELLAPWQDPQVAASAVEPDITLEWLVSGKNTLYVCAPQHDQSRLDIVFGALVSDLIYQAYDWERRRAERLRDTLVVLDEAANTPTEWLPQVVSTCSGIGILLVTVWQSKAQIDAAYGTLADSVLTNHGTKIFFSGISDPATLDYASGLLGNEEVGQRSTSTELAWGRRSMSESTTQRPLVPSDALRRMPSFNALLIHGSLHPAHLVARRYYDERRLRKVAGAPSAPEDVGADGSALLLLAGQPEEDSQG
jgi:type IV secretion system protein VirD4